LVVRVPTVREKLENVREFVLSGKVMEMSGKNIIDEKSGKMIGSRRLQITVIFCIFKY